MTAQKAAAGPKSSTTIQGTDVAVETLVEEIQAIAAAMKRIEQSRLTREAIVTLIHARSKVNKGEIELVLNNLSQLENIWLKKKQQA
jgi:hypothetical protein